MKKKLLVAGLLMVVLGICLFMVDMGLLATVEYINVGPYRPTGTLNSPAALATGEAYLILISFYDTQPTDNVFCKITDVPTGGVNYAVNYPLPFRQQFSTCYLYYDEKNPWTVPDTKGVTYKFDFYVGTQIVVTSYGLVQEINGYFTINGKKATQESIIIVTQPTLTIEFYATVAGDKIDYVSVRIKRKGALTDLTSFLMTETIESSRWGPANYTLPSTGTYEVTGFFVTFAAQLLNRMSIITSYGEMQLPILQLISLSLIAIGCIVTFAGLSSKNKNKRESAKD